MKNRKDFILILPFISLILGCSQDSSPNVNLTALVATYAGSIYQTDNGGMSWFQLNIDHEPLQYYFKRIYADPQNKNILYVTTTGNGLFKIDLLKKSMEQAESLKDQIVTSMAFLKSFDTVERYIIGTESKGIFEASDLHGSWQYLDEGLSYHEVNVLMVIGKELFAGTTKDVFKWNETDKYWVSTSKGIINKNIISMAAAPDGKIILAGSGLAGFGKNFFSSTPCLYKSIDKGLQWSAADRGLCNEMSVYAIAVNANRPERFYLGTSRGVYRSIDSGFKWNRINRGLPEGARVLDIKIIRTVEGMDAVFAVCDTKGIFMTIDNENSRWIEKNYGIEPSAISSIILMSP